MTIKHPYEFGFNDENPVKSGFAGFFIVCIVRIVDDRRLPLIQLISPQHS
jgi:hypothetical protein